MSCITEILKIKGNKEFLILSTNDNSIEGGGLYKDYEYLITFNSRGFRCGYVSVNQDHKLYNEDLWQTEDIACHGGITFFSQHKTILLDILGENDCEDKWLGFACMQPGDLRDLEKAQKIFNLSKEEVITNKHVELITSEFSNEECSIKDFSFVENECKSIIDQLIEI